MSAPSPRRKEEEATTTVTPKQLWWYLFLQAACYDDYQAEYDKHAADYDDYEQGRLSREQFEAVRAAAPDEIFCSIEVSAGDSRGDGLVDVARRVAEAVRAGADLITWYGPDTEVMVAAVMPGLLDVKDCDGSCQDRPDAPEGVEAE
jgi:hypothetical protein